MQSAIEITIIRNFKQFQVERLNFVLTCNFVSFHRPFQLAVKTVLRNIFLFLECKDIFVNYIIFFLSSICLKCFKGWILYVVFDFVWIILFFYIYYIYIYQISFLWNFRIIEISKTIFKDLCLHVNKKLHICII